MFLEPYFRSLSSQWQWQWQWPVALAVAVAITSHPKPCCSNLQPFLAACSPFLAVNKVLCLNDSVVPVEAMSIVVKKLLCLNDSVVPVEAKALPFIDPYSLATDEDETHLPVSLVHFKAKSPNAWLWQNVEMPFSSWWKQKHSQVPLFLEILNLIKGKKLTHGH